MISDTTLWTIIVALGIGSFLLRFSFIGFVGDRPMPKWLLRHLRYTAAAILPALIAPIVVYSAEDGGTDPTRLIAALAAFGVGYYFKSSLWAIVAGAATLFVGVYVLG